MFGRSQPQGAPKIDELITREMAPSGFVDFHTKSKELPEYRFVDLFRAADENARTGQSVVVVESEHREALSDILHHAAHDPSVRTLNRALDAVWPTGPGEEVFLPVERYWLCKGEGLILRLRHLANQETALLEVAAGDSDSAERALNQVIDHSAQASVYRNKILELAYESGTKDVYGDVEKASRLRVLFRRDEPVSDQDIIIDGEVREIIQRNVIDLHAKRDLLRRHRVPLRRGVLFYGPPGRARLMPAATFAESYWTPRGLS